MFTMYIAEIFMCSFRGLSQAHWRVLGPICKSNILPFCNPTILILRCSWTQGSGDGTVTLRALSIALWVVLAVPGVPTLTFEHVEHETGAQGSY